MIVKVILLLLPKYVAVLENVKVADYYSKLGGGRTYRYIDLCLVDAAGNVDVIEIKKPFEQGVLGKRQYRNKYIHVHLDH